LLLQRGMLGSEEEQFGADCSSALTGTVCLSRNIRANPSSKQKRKNLMPLVLKKSGDSHGLNLVKGTPGNIAVNLKWAAAVAPVAPPVKKSGGWFGGLFGGGETEAPKPAAAPDLDLGCMYELTVGADPKGVIQALGKLFGSRTSSPFIALDGDDRAGGSADGENLFVGLSQLKRVVIFAYIYGGSTDFRSVNARVLMKVSNGEEISVDLDSPSPKQTFCAIAQIVNQNGKLTVTKEERYFAGHKDCDLHYGFGFNWTTASK